MKFNTKIFSLCVLSIFLTSSLTGFAMSSKLKNRRLTTAEMIQMMDPDIEIPEISDLDTSIQYDYVNKVPSNVVSGAPLGVILKKVKNFFPFCRRFASKQEFFADKAKSEKCLKMVEEADKSVEKLRKMKINDAAEKISKMKPTKTNYWYYYYIVANVALRGHLNSSGASEPWVIKDSSEITRNKETFINEEAQKEVEKLVKNQSDFEKKIQICKQTTLLDLKKQLNLTNTITLREWLGDDRDSMELRDFEHSQEFVKLTTKTAFYKTISEKLPKGVIHHFHWSAAHTADNIFQAIENYLKLETSKTSVIAKVDIYKSDRAEEKLNKKTMSKNFSTVSSPKIYVFSKFDETIKKFTDLSSTNFEKIKTKLKDSNGNCLELLSESEIFKDFEKNQDELYFGYLLFCENSYLYIDDNFNKNETIKKGALFSNYEKKFKKMSDLKAFLDIETHILKSNSDLIKAYLPDSYKNKIKNVREQLSVSVWYLFENIFNLIYPLFSIDSINEELDQKISDAWKNQNVLGVEYRQSVNLKLLEIMKKHLDANKILYAFQNPGAKNRDRRLNRLSGLIYQNAETYKKNRSIGKNEEGEKRLANNIPKSHHYSGIDFFGYEDEPFNGARNFFPLSMQKILKLNELKIKLKKFQSEDLSKKIDNAKSTLEWFSPVYETIEKSKIFLHAGETMFFPNFPVDDKFLDTYYINDNLIHAAILPNLPRVGHGFAVHRNPLLQAVYMKKDISLEICPMSNESLKYYYVYEHPITKLLRNGLKLSISPDDPAFFGYEGVTFDWFKLLMETNLTPKEYFLLVKNSIEKASDIMFHENVAEAANIKKTKIAESAKKIYEFFDQLNCGELKKEQLEELKDIKKEERKKKTEEINILLKNIVSENSIFFKGAKEQIDIETSVYDVKELKQKSNSH